MATLISTADGNFTSSSTWSVVDSTSYLPGVEGMGSSQWNYAPTTPTNSTSFTPGAITIEGIAIRILFKENATLAGDILTVVLRNVTAGTNVGGTTVTLAGSDLPSTNGAVDAFPGTGLNWYYLKFSAPVTLLAATQYAIRISATTDARFAVFRGSATASDWARALVSTTNAAPASGDVLITAGAWTAPGSVTVRTVTMDNTTTTEFSHISIANNSILTYGTSPGVNYYLRYAGTLWVNGTLRIGTVGTPIPATSTAVLERFYSGTFSNSYMFFSTGCNVETCGQPKSLYTRLAANATVGATTLTLDAIPTSWNSSDSIVVAGTTRANSSEFSTLTANVTTTTASLSSSLSFLHQGSAANLTQAHVINLTRNVFIRSNTPASESLGLFVNCGFGAWFNGTVTMRNTVLQQLSGPQLTSLNMGNCNVTIDNCVIYQPFSVRNGWGLTIGSVNSPTAGLVNSNSSYSLTNIAIVQSPSVAFAIYPTTGWVSRTIDNIIGCRSTGFLLYDPELTVTNLIVANGFFGGAAVTAFGATNYTLPSGAKTVIDGGESYANASAGLDINSLNQSLTPNSTSPLTLVINNFRSWANEGVYLRFNSQVPFGGVKFTNSYFYGGGTTTTSIQGQGNSNTTIVYDNCRFWSPTFDATSVAIAGTLGQGTTESIHFLSCQFGKDHLGNNLPFTSAVFNMASLRNMYNIQAFNPTINGTVVLRSTNYPNDGEYNPGIVIQNLNGVTGSNFIYQNTSTVTPDTTIFKTASPSTRMTPFRVDVKTPSPTVRIPVKSGQTCTVSVWVRKSAVGDGAAYNGSQPFLLWRYNPAANNLAQTTVATMTVGTGTWEQLSYTTPTIAQDTVLEFAVVCDGSTGWVNIDEWQTTSANTSNDDYFASPLLGQYIEVKVPNPSISYTFIY